MSGANVLSRWHCRESIVSNCGILTKECIRENGPAWHVHQGLDFSSQFRINRFPVLRRYVRARTCVYAVGFDTHCHSHVSHASLRSTLVFFYSRSSPANLAESNVCRNCGSRSVLHFFFCGSETERDKERIADDKPQRQRFFSCEITPAK